MGQSGDRLPRSTTQSKTAEQILQAVTEDLTNLHHGLIAQLSEEVAWLRAEKTRLHQEVEHLRSQHQALQTRQVESLSQHQTAQQQLWAKQLAEVLANHLQALMVQRLNQIAVSQPERVGIARGQNGYSESANKLLSSLDSTFSMTFKTLQQELNSYQSSLSQQISRMHSMEQQGEAILEALITHLREQLQTEIARKQPASPPLNAENGVIYSQEAPLHTATPGNATGPGAGNGWHGSTHFSSATTASTDLTSPVAKPIPFEAPAAPLPVAPKPKSELSQFRLGLLLVLLSTLALSFHNVVVRVIGFKSSVLGWLANLMGTQPATLGGFIDITIFGNSLLILWLRMLVVLPLMAIVAGILYPPTWRDLNRFLTSSDRRPLLNVVVSGVSLFLSQILVYIAIGRVGPSIAVTILFMYPIITVPLAWLLFRDRPTPLRWVVMGIITMGVILAALPKIHFNQLVSGGESGILTAVLAGVAFAFYLIFMQLGFKKQLHPVPVSLIQFLTIFVLASVVLLLPLNLGVGVNPGQQPGFILGGVLLGVLTLVGYLTNNFGVRYMGAALASIVASSGPVVTTLLGLLIIQDPLQPVQIMGILLVTAGVGLLSYERVKRQPAPAKPAK